MNSGLVKLIAKRILTGIIALVGLSIITFILSHAGGPSLSISAYLNTQSPIPIAQQEKLLIAKFHLNEPLYIQYFYYVSGLLHGNWGFTSTPIYTGPVLTAIEYFLPNTIELSVVAVAIIALIGIKGGVLAAARRDGPLDNGVRVFSFLGLSLPAFWLGLLLQETFASSIVSPYLNLLPLQGSVSNSLVQNLSWYQSGVSYPTHFLFIDALIHGDFILALSNVEHLILPAITIALGSLAIIIRMMRSATITSLNQDYIKTVKMKGIPEKYLIRYHAQKNALIPTMTVLGIMFALLLSGVVLVEYVFDYPGIGSWITQAFLSDNLGGIMGANLMFGIMLISINFIVDMIYTFLDPRIRI